MKKNIKFKKNKIIALYCATQNAIINTFFMILAEIPLIAVTIWYVQGFHKTLDPKIKDAILYVEVSFIPLAFLLSFVVAYFVYKNEFYTISKDRIIAETGVFSKALMDVDIKNIVTVCYEQSLLEILTGSATILINTNATQNDSIALLHVNNYKRVYDHINKLRNKNI